MLVCDCLLAIRAATGVVALYTPYKQIWINDVSYYLLDTLPECLALCILVYPTLLARIAQAYPKPHQHNGRSEDEEGGQHTKQKTRASRITDSMNGNTEGLSPQHHNLIGTAVVLDSAQEVV